MSFETKLKERDESGGFFGIFFFKDIVSLYFVPDELRVLLNLHHQKFIRF